MLISTIVITLCLLAPFNIYAEEHDDVGYINAQQFFAGYNFTRQDADGHRLSCTNSTQTTWSCTITNETINDLQNWYNTMVIPAGLSPNRYSAYNSNNRLRLVNTPVYLVFITNTNITASNMVAYPQSGSVTVTRLTTENLTLSSPNKMYLIVMKAYNNASSGTAYTTIDFTNISSSTTIIPLYLGAEASMGDDIHRLVFGTSQNYSVTDSQLHNDFINTNNNITQGFANTNTKLTEINTGINTLNQATANIFSKVTSIDNKLTDTNNYLYEIKNGTNSSNTSVSQLETKTGQFESTANTISNFESTMGDNLDDALENINISSDILSNNNFLTSANWVRSQYNRMINNNPLSSMIYFSLILGLSLVIIGKLRS